MIVGEREREVRHRRRGEKALCVPCHTLIVSLAHHFPLSLYEQSWAFSARFVAVLTRVWLLSVLFVSSMQICRGSHPCERSSLYLQAWPQSRLFASCNHQLLPLAVLRFNSSGASNYRYTTEYAVYILKVVNAGSTTSKASQLSYVHIFMQVVPVLIPHLYIA